MAEITRLHGDVEAAINKYGDSLLSLCSVMLRNREDAKEAVQETFLKCIQKAPDFESDEHEKAWLIRVATNECKDMLRFSKRRSLFSLEDVSDIAADENDAQILSLLMMLDEKYRVVMHLHYVEEYKIEEISKLLGISGAAVKKRLQRGREALRELLGKKESN